jgi:hypothetical protein
MYLKGYIERLTGTADIIRIARENNLQEPDFEQKEDFKTILYRPSTNQVPANYPLSSEVLSQEFRNTAIEIRNLLKVMEGEMSRKEIQDALELKHIGNFRENYLEPALTDAVIEMKYPDSPNHPRQKYLVTEKGNIIKNILFHKK